MEIAVKRFWLVGKYISDHFLCKGVCLLFASCLAVYTYNGLRVRLSEMDPSFVKIDLYTIGNVGVVRLKVTINFIQNLDRKSTRLNSSHVAISYAVFCLKKKNKKNRHR